MARIIYCDFCGNGEAAGIYSNVSDGTTIATCAECMPLLLTTVAQAYGLIQAVTDEAPNPPDGKDASDNIGDDYDCDDD